MRVAADDRTIRLRKQRQAQCVGSSGHYALASACVTFLQDVAWSLLSEPYIAIPDRRCVFALWTFLLFFKPVQIYTQIIRSNPLLNMVLCPLHQYHQSIESY